MTEALVIVGIGGFGREVADVVEAINAAGGEPPWDLLGMIDDHPTALNLGRLADRGLCFLGGVARFLASGPPPAKYVVGIGSPAIREIIANMFDASGFSAATLIHPGASFGSRTSIGEGSVVCAGVRLTTNIGCGRHVHLNLNATVGHDSTLGDFVSVNPLASISGDCHVHDRALIGVGGIVLNGLNVHADAVVGGNACVVRDVASGSVVTGVPATPRAPSPGIR